MAKILSSKEAEIYKFLYDNKDLALSYLFGINLCWYQRLWLRGCEKCSKNFIVAGRGAGKSEFLKNYALTRAIFYPGERIGIISASFRQSKNVFDKLSPLYNSNEIFHNFVERFSPNNPTEPLCILKNGSRISALPIGDDGGTIRGARFHTVLIDEVTQLDKDLIDQIILPMMQIKKNPITSLLINDAIKTEEKDSNRLIMTGTATWQFNPIYNQWVYFNEEMKKGGTDYFAMTVTLDDVRTVVGMLDEDIIRLEQETMDPILFRMENYGFWPSDSEGFFSARKCEDMRDKSFKMVEKGLDDHIYVVGIDPADVESGFAIVVLDITSNENVGVAHISTKPGSDSDKQIDEIRRIYRDFNVVRGCMDSKGGGTWVMNELQKDFFYADDSNNLRLQTFNTNSLELTNLAHPTIDEMNWNLRGRIANELLKVQGRIHESKEDYEDKTNAKLEHKMEMIEEVNGLIKELQSIIAEPTGTGVRFKTVKRHQKKDRYSALLLANWAHKLYMESQTTVEEAPVGIWL